MCFHKDQDQEYTHTQLIIFKVIILANSLMNTKKDCDHKSSCIIIKGIRQYILCFFKDQDQEYTHTHTHTHTHAHEINYIF